MERETAIKIVKNNWPEGRVMLQEALKTLIPELKESENERIRKELINYIKAQKITPNHPIADEWISWLEKQDTKKHEKELDEAYKCADEVQYRKGYEDAKRELEKQGEQKPAERILPYGKNETAGKLIALAECLEMDGDCSFNGLSGDDYGRLLRTLAKELIVNLAWSEEDEDAIDIAIRIIQNGGDDCAGIIDSDKALKWLKSLKDRVVLQDEQMISKGERKNVALSIINYLNDNRIEGCMDLSSIECEDLKNAVINYNWQKVYNYMKKKFENL